MSYFTTLRPCCIADTLEVGVDRWHPLLRFVLHTFSDPTGRDWIGVESVEDVDSLNDALSMGLVEEVEGKYLVTSHYLDIFMTGTVYPVIDKKPLLTHGQLSLVVVIVYVLLLLFLSVISIPEPVRFVIALVYIVGFGMYLVRQPLINGKRVHYIWKMHNEIWPWLTESEICVTPSVSSDTTFFGTDHIIKESK